MEQKELVSLQNIQEYLYLLIEQQQIINNRISIIINNKYQYPNQPNPHQSTQTCPTPHHTFTIFMIESGSLSDQTPSQLKQITTPQKLSTEVFLGYLKWTAITMLSASIISIVVFVLLNATYTTTSSLKGYSTLSRLFLKTTLLAAYETVEQCDDITPGYWCRYPTDSIESFVFKPSNGKFTNPKDVNRLIANHTTQTQICYHLNTFKIKIGEVEYNAREIKVFCYAMDGFIMCVAFVLLVVNEYRAEQKHREEKRNMIDKFSVRVGNLPELPKYELLWGLKEYLEKEVERYLEENPISKYKFSIFDITSNIPNELEMLKDNLSENQFTSNDGNCQKSSKYWSNLNTNVWVTFQSISNRKLVLNIFKHNTCHMKYLSCFNSKIKLFYGKVIEVEKAPNPQDIIHNNLNATYLSRLIVRLIIYIVTLLLLILSTLLLLFLKRLSSIIVSSLAVLITNTLAPILLIFLSKYQRHSLITNQNISNINKIAIYKFINTGLVVFLSQFKFEGLVSYFSHYFNYFTNQEYSSVTSMDWILSTGLSMVYTMILYIVLSNFKILGEYILYYVRLWNERRKMKPGDQQPTVQIGPIKGYELYGQIAAVTMIILSYSYLLPILYPIGFLIFFTNNLTCRHMKKYMVFPADSFNNLTKTATSWTLLAIILHMGIVGFIEESKVHYVITCVIGVLYVFRMFLMRVLVGMISSSLRGRRIRKDSKKRDMENVEDPEFRQMLSESQRWMARTVLKARRAQIQKFIHANSNIDHKYPLMFRQLLKYQRDVIKYTPRHDKLQGKIIGAVTYHHDN